MIFEADLLLSASIVFTSMGLFVYWVVLAVVVLRGPQTEIDRVLEGGLGPGRGLWS
jgi:hypothetical protein